MINIDKNTLYIFIISSLVSIITITYLGVAYYRKQKPSNVNFKLMVLIIPLIYGISGVINYKMIEEYGINSSLIVGGLVGLLFSLVGRFILNLPTKLFEFTKNNEYQVHIIAVILYSIIFRFIITPLSIIFS